MFTAPRENFTVFPRLPLQMFEAKSRRSPPSLMLRLESILKTNMTNERPRTMLGPPTRLPYW